MSSNEVYDSATNPENEIYKYMIKKKKKEKAKSLQFAGLNKFLRIYYARAMNSKAEKNELKLA